MEINKTNTEVKSSKGIDFYFVILLIATVFYLLLECAFNATLLDVAGADVTIDKIHSIEFWGRIISGIAVALAFCGTVIFPYLHKRKAKVYHYLNYGIIAFIYLIALTYYGQKLLIDTLVENSTAEQRRIATLVSVASNQLRSGELLIEGFDLSEDARETPSTKAFVASFASIVSFLPNAEKIIMSELDDILKMHVVNQVGTLNDVYYGPYQESLKELATYYEEYAEGIQKMHTELGYANNVANAKWNQYVERLKSNRISVSNIRKSYHTRIRNEVLASGLNVPKNWNPSDQKTFKNTVIKQYKETVYAEANKQIKEKTPNNESLPLDLTSFDKFLANKTIQKIWKEKLSFPLDVQLKRNMKLAAFQKEIYDPLIKHLVKKNKEMLLSKADSFDAGKEFEEVGKKAFEASIVPPIAIAFSIVGIIVHLCKAGFYALRIILPVKMMAVVINIVLFAVLLYLPMFFTTPITSSSVYEVMEENLQTKSKASAFAFRWILQSQTFVYPVNELIREKVFLGMSFGMNNEENKSEEQIKKPSDDTKVETAN